MTEGIITLGEPQVWAIGLAVAFMAMDIITGFTAACINCNVSSSKMRVGLGHKLLLMCLIALALLIEVAGEHIAGLGFGGVTTILVCGYIIVMEVSSCAENICSAYPELADTPVMRVFNHDGDEKEGMMTTKDNVPDPTTAGVGDSDDEPRG